MIRRKIQKYYEFVTTRLKIMIREKQHLYGGCKLKYMLEKNKSSKLIVVFSGIPRAGLKARYNYNRTLKNANVNKLFILDDLGYDKRGGYYLGKDKKFFMEKAVLDLISKVKSDLDITETIYCGSSKGGWAAIFFGIRDNGSRIIAGSLQYLLGNYVTRNEIVTENLMKYVMGPDFTQGDVEFLNNLLRDTIKAYSNNDFCLYLHYSDSEFTYEDHMIHLINDLRKFGIHFSEDVQHYKNHNELSLYFPEFLRNKVNELIKQDNYS